MSEREMLFLWVLVCQIYRMWPERRSRFLIPWPPFTPSSFFIPSVYFGDEMSKSFTVKNGAEGQWMNALKLSWERTYSEWAEWASLSTLMAIRGHSRKNGPWPKNWRKLRNSRLRIPNQSDWMRGGIFTPQEWNECNGVLSFYIRLPLFNYVTFKVCCLKIDQHVIPSFNDGLL